MRTSAGLVVEVSDRVASLTIDRPERRNALSRAVKADLIRCLDRFEHDDGVWLVRLRGAGDVSFSSGADLKEMAEEVQVPQGAADDVQRNVFEAVRAFGKPTIASLNGYALGGGLELALACDIRLAANHARLGMPEAKRGLGADFGTQMIARLIPPGIAFEMLYTARELSAREAARWGLVNHVHPLVELDEACDELCRRILSNAPLSVRRFKAMLVHGLDLPIAAALQLRAGPDPYRSRDRSEGIAAFVEEREPRWRAH